MAVKQLYIDQAVSELLLVGIGYHSYRTISLNTCGSFFFKFSICSKVAIIVASLNVKILHKHSTVTETKKLMLI